ncbi:MAG TPA: phytanoyl-CoA dioxygenase family protein [Capillimicrobium sp.]|nr:phytanoyl-CoA dioxygenase family protein [Capillimicrobium sp.]
MSVIKVNCREDGDWLEVTLGAVRHVGCAVVEGVLTPERCEEIREKLYAVQQAIRDDIGEERLARAGELGVLRNMGAYDPSLLELIALPEILAVVDATVSETAILHLQNGFILPSKDPAESNGRGSFQQSYHRDFPRYLDGYLASINTLLTIDAFTPANGGTLVAPGTHQRPERPSDAYLKASEVAVDCAPGSMIVFDSTLWHAAGVNRSGRDRVGINQQYTRSFFKQQIDYVRALGDDVVLAQPDRVQQLLGWYTRVVTSLDEYYRPAEERLYRSGQG